MRKILLGLSVVLALAVLMVPLASANVLMEPTSLEVWLELDSAYIEGEDLFVLGHWYVMNVGENPAIIQDLCLLVEVKSKGNPWQYLPESWWFTGVPFTVSPGDTFSVILPGDVGLPFTVGTGEWTAFRYQLRVHLLNHPSGDRWFYYRESFEDLL